VPGRSLGLPGAHCQAGGMNTRGIGVALIGNFEERRPFPEQVAALNRLLRELRIQYGIPLPRILGHCQVPGAKTLCPGKYFPYAQMLAGLKV